MRRLIRKQEPKTDALQREHLPAWFEHMQACTQPHARAYLMALLLTGARANEMAGLRWEDVEATFYSDSMNDVPLLEKVDHPVATNPDARLRELAVQRGWRILDLLVAVMMFAVALQLITAG